MEGDGVEGAEKRKGEGEKLQTHDMNKDASLGEQIKCVSWGEDAIVEGKAAGNEMGKV